MIAAAIASRPALILCDEPTTALDVTVQAQIIRLFADLSSDLNVSLLYVTHDLAVVSQLCERVAVMRSGRLVEQGDLKTVFTRSTEPYTRMLLDAMPTVTPSARIRRPRIEVTP